jgi:hypothetical protein
MAEVLTHKYWENIGSRISFLNGLNMEPENITFKLVSLHLFPDI